MVKSVVAFECFGGCCGACLGMVVFFQAQATKHAHSVTRKRGKKQEEEEEEWQNESGEGESGESGESEEETKKKPKPKCLKTTDTFNPPTKRKNTGCPLCHQVGVLCV